MKDEDVVKAWNGEGSKAEEHTKQVFSNLEALKDPSNKIINDYISERLNYEGENLDTRGKQSKIIGAEKRKPK